MKKIAYFSAEFAISQNLHIYSGGLGVVAGNFLMAAGKLGLPVVGVSILWSEGYYNQTISYVGDNSFMRVDYIKRKPKDLADTGLLLNAKIAGSDVKIRVWEVPRKKYGVCPTYLLDTDISENDNNPLSKLITTRLYQGNEDRRLAQKIILSKGVEALERLGYSIDIYHLNEGFCLSVALEFLRRELQKGLSFKQALENIKKKIIFTTHTPEIAGNEIHNIDDMYKMGCLSDIAEKDVKWLGEGNILFNVTASLLKMAKISNGVSVLHTSIAQKMWNWVNDSSSIISITNGIDKDFWQYRDFKDIDNLGDLRKYKLMYKRNLLRQIHFMTGKCLGENILTIVWARRFAEYKRPLLIFQDLRRIENYLKYNKIQIIFAGKPHPNDQNMINVWNYIHHLSAIYPNLVILPDYELDLSKRLKAGADVWLNTPRRPREACGTSGISAALNVAINFASRDGLYIEFITDKNNGFLFGVDHGMLQHQQDQLDYESLMLKLDEIINIYYGDKNLWHQIALSGKNDAEKYFCAERMIKEYYEKMYEV